MFDHMSQHKHTRDIVVYQGDGLSHGGRDAEQCHRQYSRRSYDTR